MRVDQITRKYSRYLGKFSWLLILFLSSCQLELDQVFKVLDKPQDKEVAFEPPLGLQALSTSELAELKVLETISSKDRAGHQRLQLYVYYSGAFNQNLYWQLIETYRPQYDIIWIYLTKTAELDWEQSRWNSQATWFSPKIPKSFHFLNYPYQHHHDTLYWSDEH